MGWGLGALCCGEEGLDVLAEFAAGRGGIGGGLVGAEAEEGCGGETALGTGGRGVGELGAKFGERLKVGLGQDVGWSGDRLGECLGIHAREFDWEFAKSKCLFG